MPTFDRGEVWRLRRDAGMLFDRQGPGRVKSDSTSSTGKIGTTGCPFVCTSTDRLTEDAA